MFDVDLLEGKYNMTMRRAIIEKNSITHPREKIWFLYFLYKTYPRVMQCTIECNSVEAMS